MKNPNKHRAIMFLILFSGFGVMGLGAVFVTEEWLRYVLFGVGIVMAVISTVYGVRHVRCPHCHRLLSMKITYTVTCPYCRQRVDEE